MSRMASAKAKPGLTGEQAYQEREKKSKSTTTILPVIPNDPQRLHRCRGEYNENGRALTRLPLTDNRYLEKSEAAVRGITAAVQRIK